MFYTLVPLKLVLYSLVTYLSSGEEKSILILQGCTFLFLGLFWSKRSRRRRQDTKLRTSDVSLAVSSGVLATQLLRVADSFSTRQIPLSESGPSLNSIPCRPKQADIFAHSNSSTGSLLPISSFGQQQKPVDRIEVHVPR
jgi:hypothetical protein